MHHVTEFSMLLVAQGDTIKASVLNESNNIYWSFTDTLLRLNFFSYKLFLPCESVASLLCAYVLVCVCVWAYGLFLMFWQETKPKMSSLKASG